MAESRYVELIEKLIQKTKEKIIKWNYLDTNSTLYSNMGWCKKTINSVLFTNEEIIPAFNTEMSFFAFDKGFQIVILVMGTNPADLYIIPNTYKRVLGLYATEYGEHITRLLNLVLSQFPDSEDYVDMILNKDTRQ